MNLYDNFIKSLKAKEDKKRLQEESLHELHPEGIFKATIVDIAPPKPSKALHNQEYVTIQVKTEHGYLYIAIASFKGPIFTIYSLIKYLEGTEVTVRNRHRVVNGFHPEDKKIYSESTIMPKRAREA